MIAKEKVTYWKATPFSRRVNGMDPDKSLFDKSLLHEKFIIAHVQLKTYSKFISQIQVHAQNRY
jgi:hypothetical protein